MRTLLLALVPVVSVLAAPVAAQSSVTEVVRAASPGVVNVNVLFQAGNGATRVERASSGAILTAQGLVLTNRHLVEELLDPDQDTYWLAVTVGRAREYSAKVVAHDERLDLALLQLEANEVFAAFPLADDAAPRPGERVVALGFPQLSQRFAFAGALALCSGPIRLGDALLQPEELLMSDSRFHKMLDGGPLVDSRGRLLGIHNTRHIEPPFTRVGEEGERRQPSSSGYDVIVSASAIRAAFPEQLASVTTEPRLQDVAPDEATAAIEAIAPAVVSVWAGEPEEFPEVPDPTDPQAQRIDRVQGSGVVVDPSGLVLTHAKVFRKEDRDASVRLADGRTFPAEVLELDRGKKVALLKLDLPAGTSLEAATLGDSSALIAGEFAAVVGRPFASALTMSVGVISSLEREDFVQLASWVHHGHWGGALVDRNGRLCGIAVEEPRMSDADEESYLGFACPLHGLFETFADHWSAATTPYSAAETAARRNFVSAVTEATRGSMINVLVKKALPRDGGGFDPFGSDEPEFRLLGQGSGVVIHESGIALSNWHVVDAAVHKDGSARDDFRVEVTMPGDREYSARVISTSRDDDLALLAIELGEGEQVEAIELGDSEAIRVGDHVIAIGNPLGLQNSVSAGVISAKNHSTLIQGRLHVYEGMLMTDAAINPGNSGGALLDGEGRLVGINSAGSVGAGLAIPVKRALDVIEEKLLSTERTRSVYLGLVVEEDDGALEVARVDEGGPASLAGLTAGDRIVSYAGEPVSSRVVFACLRMDTVPGQPVALAVERGGERRTVELEPRHYDSWKAFRQSGIEVAEVDYASESALVQTASVELHRAYTGNADDEPSRLMTGALRVTRSAPLDEDSALDVRTGDLLLGYTAITRTTADVYERLVRFENLDDLSRHFDELATKDGTVCTCWLMRDGEIVGTRVLVRRPPR